jgi:hypothetical protein
VKLANPPVGDAGYDAWLVNGLQHGQSYFGDGRSHIFDFSIEGGVVGTGPDELHFDAPTEVRVVAHVCARLEPEITGATEKIRGKSPFHQPYWHLERSRVGTSRKVPVELIINGASVQRIELEADGKIHAVAFEVTISTSSWVAIRILPSSHTNPITVKVGSKPVRASRRSAEWCRRGVDTCWEQKWPRIRRTEIAEAKVAYDHARSAYDRIISEFPA